MTAASTAATSRSRDEVVDGARRGRVPVQSQGGIAGFQHRRIGAGVLHHDDRAEQPPAGHHALGCADQFDPVLRIGRVLAVDAELPRAVLARDFTDGGVDSRAAEGIRQHLPEEGESTFGAGDGVGMRFHVIDDQRSLVVSRGPAAGLADQGLKTELPAGLGRCLKAGEVRVPLAEGHCGRRAVQPQRRADPAGLGHSQQLNAEFQVPAAPSDSSCRTMVSVAGAPAACCILLSSLMVILQFLVVAAAFAVIDAIWLKTMNPFYRGQIGELLADRPNLGYAVVFYVIYIAGIVFFALRPALDGGSWLSAVGYGAALGAFAYATYDLTNAATLKTWPLQLIVVDILWGAALTALATLAGWLVFHRN